MCSATDEARRPIVTRLPSHKLLPTRCGKIVETYMQHANCNGGRRRFGSSGRVFNKAQIIEALEQEPCDATYRITLVDFTVRRLAPDVMLVTYSTTIQDRSESRLQSSIWKLISGHWQMVFHQGTPS